jgi:taurine dioxygenase
MALNLRPLMPTFGAEVLDLDLREELPLEVMAEIRAAWVEYNVLVFRGQTWNADEQRRFARYFGQLQTPHAGAQAGSETLFIGNKTVDGIKGDIPDGEMEFHSDGAYHEKPTRGSMLFAIEIPSRGGDTLFGNTIQAFKHLPSEIQEQVLGREVYMNFDYRDYAKPNRENWAPDVPHFAHPFVTLHESGRPAVFCSRMMADHIIGMSRAQGRVLIDRVNDEIERPGNVYQHVWKVGDVVFWDNAATVHARTDFDKREHRWMRRCAFVGERPVAYPVPALTR